MLNILYACKIEHERDLIRASMVTEELRRDAGVGIIPFLYRTDVSFGAETDTADLIAQTAAANGCAGIIIGPSVSAAQIAARISIRKHMPCLTNVKKLKQDKGCLFAEREVYNNLLLAVCNVRAPFVITEDYSLDTDIRPAAVFDTIHQISLPQSTDPPCRIIGESQAQARRYGAQVALIAGRGVSSKRDVAQIREFAAENGFDFGVSRPVAMCGWAGIDELIGVSGQKLYARIAVTIGVSGSAAFFTGIENCGFILSVNTNKNAPIAEKCDAFLEEKYQNVLPRLFEKMKRR